VSTLRILLVSLAFCAVAGAQPAAGIMPLGDVRAGMRATGRTVFAGGQVEEFQVEVLGVMENVGPRQSIILAKLSGGPLGHTGVMQGMSGSPVYYEGKLLGAVALSFPFSKDPIAGIRPAEEMMASGPGPGRQQARLEAEQVLDPRRALPARQEVTLGPQKLAEVATPFWMTGISQRALDYFAPSLRAAGFEPVQGVSGGGRPSQQAGARVRPGEMISVQLVTGDMSVGADGTVTHVDGDRVWAFGHRFLSLGDAEMPFTRSEVLTLLASNQISFKISSPKEWVGSITQDRSAAISGVVGRKPRMLPLKIRVNGRTGVPVEQTYRMEMVQDRLMTPLLLQMAVFSAVEATERSAGLASIAMRGEVRLQGGAPVRLENLYAAELGAPQMVSAGAAAPVAMLMQSGFDETRIESVDIQLDVVNEQRQMQLDSVWASRREVRPGETVEITAVFKGDGNSELTRRASYLVPEGALEGPLYFTVSDALTSNISEYRQFLTTPPRDRQQLLEFLNGVRPNTKAFVRVWRPEKPSWQVQGEILPQPPPSAALVLSKGQAQTPGAKVAELELASGDFVFAGSKTLQVVVKE
jgi:hypothetical protein